MTGVAALLLGVAVLLGAGCERDDTALQASLGAAASSTLNLRLLRSRDQGASWRLDEAVLAHGVSSLHACTVEGRVWVPALLDTRSIPWWETAFPIPFLDSFQSSDLTTWTAHRSPLRGDTTGGVDPACVVGPRGLEMWFAEVLGSFEDPAKGDHVSQIWRSRWLGDRFGEAEIVTTGTGLIDPAPIYIDGALRLFLNKDGDHIVELVGDTLVDRWMRVTVPAAVDLGDRRWLLGQAPRGPGMMPVAREILADGLGDPFPLAIDAELHSCESPSMTTLGPEWLLFCVQTNIPGQPQ